MSLLGLSPGLFFGALIIVSLAALALHFLRVRSPQVIVPTVIFWREAVKERAPRVLFRRLARLGTLLLVLAILWAMVVAAGEPGYGPDDAVHEVLVLDPGVFSLPRAREEAVRKLKSLTLGDGSVRRATVLATTPVKVLCGFDDPSPTPARALQDTVIEEAYAPVDWKRAFRAAGSLLADRHDPRVRAYTLDPDSLPPDAESLCEAKVAIELLPAPEWDDGMEAASPVFGPDGTADILIKARRRGAGIPGRKFIVEQDGSVLTEGVLDQTGQARAVLKGYVPGTRIAARFSDEDEVPGNDALSLEISERPGLRVFAPDAGPVLAAALDALDRVELVSDPAEAAVAVVRTLSGAGAAGSLPMLHFKPAPEEPGEQGKRLTPLRVASDHPLVAGLTFQGVRVPAPTDLGYQGGEIVLCKAGEGVASKIVMGDPARVILGLDPEQGGSGLAESFDFPRFFHRAIQILGGEPRPGGGMRRGGWSPLSAGLNMDSLAIDGPGGRRIHVPLKDGEGEWMTDSAGSHNLAGRVAVNVPGGGPPLACPREAADRVSQEDIGKGGLPLSFVLTGLALILLLIEWWALHRGKVA